MDRFVQRAEGPHDCTQALGWSCSVGSDLQTHSPSGSQTLLCANNFTFLHSYSVALTKACVAFI